MMFYKSITGLAAGLMLFGIVGTANSTLTGDEVTCAVVGGLTCSSATATVGNGVEFRLSDGPGNAGIVYNVNLFGTGITIESRANRPALGPTMLTLSSLNWTNTPGFGVITGISSFGQPGNASGPLSGFVIGDVSTGPNSATFDLTGTSPSFSGQPNPSRTAGTTRFTVDHNVPVPAAVPEPATILLLGSGLAGLTLWRLRKTAKA